MKHEVTTILSRVAGHARQARDCAMLGERAHAIKPLTRRERALVKRVVRTHARFMAYWAKHLG